MNNSSESPKREPLDPRLRRFLHRAFPVIAVERGLNENSMIKLRAIADDLKLPTELYEDGLRKLKKVSVGKKLTRYEREFNRFLNKQFRRLAGGILTVKMERKAIEIGKAQYQIPAERAAQIIAENCIKHNVGRISRTEAEHHVEIMINERIKNASFIDAETRKRLYLFGKEWGIESTRVDSMIEQTLIQNRQEEKIQGQTSRSWMFPVGLAVVGTALLFGYYFFIHKKSAAPDENQTAKVEEVKIQFPSWWPESTQLSAAKIRNSNATFGQLFDGLIANSPQQRKTACRELILFLLESSPDTSGDYSTIWDIALDVFSLEPVEEIQNEISEFLTDKIVVDRNPVDAKEIDHSFRTNELGYQLVNELRPSSKIVELLTTQIESKTGHYPQNNTQYLKKSQAAIARAIWRNFETAVWNDTPKALKLLSPIANSTKSKLSEPVYDAQLSDGVTAALEAAPDQWQNHGIQKWIAQVIQKTDKSELIRWIDISETTSNQALAASLRMQLADRLGLKKLPKDAVAAVKALRKLATGTESLDSKIASRWQNWDIALNRNISVHRVTANTQVTPQEIANTAYFTTLGMLLRSQQHEQILKFEQLLDAGPPKLREAALALDGGVLYRNASGGSPRSWDVKSLADLIEKLKPDSGSSDIVRRASFEQIAKLADRFKDISLPQATVLTDFCLAATDDDHLLTVQQNLPQMIHWLNLSLVFADKLKLAKLPKDRLLAIAETLSGTSFRLSGNDWKNQLHHDFLKHIQKSLEYSVRQNKSDQRGSWELLAYAMSNQYNQRLEALGASRQMQLKWTTLQEKQLLAIHLVLHPEDEDDAISKKITNDLLALEQLATSQFRQAVLLEHRLAIEYIKQNQGAESSETAKDLTRRIAGLPQAAQKLLYTQKALIKFFDERNQQ